MDDWNRKREKIAALYSETLADINDLNIPTVRPDCAPVYHLYTVSSPRRDALKDYLQKNNIQSGIHYPIPIHRQEAYQDLGYQDGDFPVSEASAKSTLSLPLWPEMKEEQAVEVCHHIKKYFGLAS